MIYTVTFNPAIDYTARVSGLCLGSVNRTDSELVIQGGKGINVSVVLKNLGHESTALGFISGFTGNELKRLVSNTGCVSDFIDVYNGYTRINVKLKSDSETDINGQGPAISKENIKMLIQKINALNKDDILVLAGSVPTAVSDKVYGNIMECVNGKGVITIVDAVENLLMNTLKYRPFLIKPNNHELNAIFKTDIGVNKDTIIKYAKILQELGARNVLISMAGDGAVLLTEHGDILKSEAPKGSVVNSVGAGDSMVAGFIAGWLDNGDYTHAFKMGLAAGSASAFSEKLAVKDDIMRLYDTINMIQ